MPPRPLFFALLSIVALVHAVPADRLPGGVRLRLGTSDPQTITPVHASGVTTVAFSRDGKSLLTAGGDGTAALWDAATGRLLRRLGEPGGWICFASVSPDDRLVAAAGYGAAHAQSVHVWEAQTGKLLHRLEGHANGARSVAFTPDGRLLASGGFDGYLRLWDLTTGKRLLEVAAHRDGIPALACTPDNKLLASAGYDGQVRFWDLPTGVMLRQIAPSEGRSLYALAFSPDGRFLAVGGEDGAIRILEVLTGGEAYQLKGHTGLVHSLGFSRDGRRLVSGSYDKTARVWEVRTEREARSHQGHKDWVWCVSLSPNGRALATASKDASAFVWKDLPSPPPRPWRPDPGQGHLAALWDELASEDVRRAYRTVDELGAIPVQTVTFLQTRLLPATAGESFDPKHVARFIAQLDDDDFEVREKASATLRGLGSGAAPELRKALAANPSAEVQRRIEILLERFRQSVVSEERRRQVRALHVLEEVATPPARRLLDRLAGGAPEAALTLEARAARDRLVGITP